MSQKTKLFVCDRPFVCPACKSSFDEGDVIGMLVPQKVRYCEPCLLVAVERINQRGRPAETKAHRDIFGGPAAGGPITTYELKPSDGKPRLPTTADKTDYVERYIHAKLVDKVFDLEKQLLELQNQLKALDARVESLE